MTELIMVRGTRHEVHECLTCGCIVVASEKVLDQRREQGGSYYCQNGHSQGWSQENSEIEKLRRERDRLKQDQARLEQEVAERDRQLETKEREAARLKKRASAGVCPCCNRTVAQMARHMKAKHPNFNVVPIKASA